ncbi:hypothetical protein HYV73_01505 [Candidatus Uhrbacteria bacterium]|nr:hypothetical protein [Candidatus Uhrbacteria bacterium]
MPDQLTPEPEDMFADTTEAPPALPTPSAPRLPSPVPLPSEPPAPLVPLAPPAPLEESSRGGFPWKAILIVVGVLVVIVAAAYVAFTLLAQQSKGIPFLDQTPQPAPQAPPNTQAPPTEPVTPPVVEPTTEAPPVAPITTPTPAPVAATDTDGDGLTDQEEAFYGTNPSVADTDGDGLSDREEIMKYKTNPKNADSDGDGFADGTEVKNGYNPAGEGKLLPAPVAPVTP